MGNTHCAYCAGVGQYHSNDGFGFAPCPTCGGAGNRPVRQSLPTPPAQPGETEAEAQDVSRCEECMAGRRAGFAGAVCNRCWHRRDKIEAFQRMRAEVEGWEPDDDFGLGVREWTAIRSQILRIIDTQCPQPTGGE